MPNRNNPAWGFAARNRVRCSYPLVIGALLWQWLSGTPPLHPLNDGWGMAGLVTLLLGTALRSWAAGYVVKDQQLATTGPYALVRHPLYVGSWLMLSGTAVLLGGWLFLLLLALPMGLLYLGTISNEEQVLSGHFGQQWQDYCQNTSWLGPKRWPQQLLGGWSLQQWRHNREWQGPLMAALAVALLLLWRQLAL